MPECEICGANVKKLYRVEIDGAILNVCKDCAKLGRLLDEPKKFRRKRRPLIDGGKEIDEEILDSEYASKIKKARELLKYTRENLAKKLGVKLSFWERIEKGEAKPTIEIAKRVERVLGVQIISRKKETTKEDLKVTVEKLKEKYKPQKKRKRIKRRKASGDIPNEEFDNAEVKSKPLPPLTIGDIANIVVKKKKKE